MASALTAKLQLKPGTNLVLMNAPEGYADRLASALEGVTFDGARQAEAVLVFVAGLDEALDLAPKAFARVAVGGLAWIAYPKASSKDATDVNRDRLREALRPTGWRPVRQVALDDVWSAMRYRPEKDVGGSGS